MKPRNVPIPPWGVKPFCRLALNQAPQSAAQTLVTEMDGTMLPIVTTKIGPGLDARKGKEPCWGEARLCLARPLDVADGIYGATFGALQVAGVLWRQVAGAASSGASTWAVRPLYEKRLRASWPGFLQKYILPHDRRAFI